MLKENKKTLIITSIITLLPLAAGLILWSRLPDRMAVHFDAESNADGYGSKAFAVFGLPLIMLAVHWIAAITTANDPRKKNISPLMFSLVLWISPAISLLCGALLYAVNLGKTVNIKSMSGLIFGILLVVIGFILPKCSPNYTIGIRLPWTQDSEENWTRTHRFAGVVWIVCGAAAIVLTFCGAGMGWSMGAILAAAAIPCVYSYILYKKGVE